MANEIQPIDIIRAKERKANEKQRGANEKQPIDIIKKMLEQVDLNEIVSQCETGKIPKGIEYIFIAQLMELIDSVGKLTKKVEELEKKIGERQPS